MHRRRASHRARLTRVRHPGLRHAGRSRPGGVRIHRLGRERLPYGGPHLDRAVAHRSRASPGDPTERLPGGGRNPGRADEADDHRSRLGRLDEADDHRTRLGRLGPPDEADDHRTRLGAGRSPDDPRPPACHPACEGWSFQAGAVSACPKVKGAHEDAGAHHLGHASSTPLHRGWERSPPEAPGAEALRPVPER